MIGKLIGTGLLVLAIGGSINAVAETRGPDRPGDDDRYFSGTVVGEPFSFHGEVQIDLSVDGEDPHTHILADVTGRNRENNCGTWKPGSFMDGEDDWWGAVGDKRLERLVTRLLPVGTKVEGYMALAESAFILGDASEIADGSRTKEEAVSYLHLGSVESTSVNESVVATGWAKSWGPLDGSGLEADDPVVQREHEAVVAVEKGPGLRRVEAVCGDREREADKRREERRHRRHLAAIAAAAKEKHDREETERLYGDDNWRHTMGFDDNDGGGYSTGGGTPNYCPPGGCH
jgi:hypothetical protein